ncbi:UDP-N-acetylmuramoylalanine--D-glutamate ligase [Alteromonadaceae bacterium Bs31]|nr:UDP-N-acetylmuramoylalanine--D-glutamate ligase [Alteromonadaceae bacterium Bs31]
MDYYGNAGVIWIGDVENKVSSSVGEIITTDEYYVILGLGLTGLSVVRYLKRKNIRFVVMDTRAEPPGLEALRSIDTSVPVYLGSFSVETEQLLLEAAAIVISPGVSRQQPEIKKALSLGVQVVGDVELFLRDNTKPVIGITGSNGKTTVTTLVGKIAESAAVKVCVAGNIGVPVLERLSDEYELYVLELSSFQLESISSGALNVACVLNISEDHMDRYNALAEYCLAKQRIFWGAKSVVYNLDDRLTQPPVADGVPRYGFAIGAHKEEGEKKYLLNSSTKSLEVDGRKVLSLEELKMMGLHNVANALAVLAICDAAALPRDLAIEQLKEFKGLPHRCEWVSDVGGVVFINDSKATNVGAAEAAIEGLKESFSSLVLIVGGEGKGADFRQFAQSINQFVSALVLIGRDAELIGQHVQSKVKKVSASTMDDAVKKAFSLSEKHGAVLLSPACASFDMFSGYEDRGNQFRVAVGGLVA